MNRQTDRQRDRLVDGQQIWTDGQTDRQTARLLDRQRDRLADS